MAETSQTSDSNHLLSKLIEWFKKKFNEKRYIKAVKEALRANGEQLLNNSDFLDIFKDFIKYQKKKIAEEDHVLEGDVEKIIRWFDLAKQKKFPEIYDRRNELASVFEKNYHDEIDRAYKGGQGEKDEFCKEIMKQCAVKLDLSDEFDEFKNELMKISGISDN